MRIAADGSWYHEGSQITRPAMVRAFAGLLNREADGSYWLVVPYQKLSIEVEDACFIATDVTETEGDLAFRLNTDELVVAGPDHPIRVTRDPETGEPSPYVLVRDGLEARLTRPVFYELVDLGMELTVDGAQIYGVWSTGHFFRIGPVPEELQE